MLQVRRQVAPSVRETAGESPVLASRKINTSAMAAPLVKGNQANLIIPRTVRCGVHSLKSARVSLCGRSYLLPTAN